MCYQKDFYLARLPLSCFFLANRSRLFLGIFLSVLIGISRLQAFPDPVWDFETKKEIQRIYQRVGS